MTQSSKQAYGALAAHSSDTVALGQIGGLLGWDQETMMAPGSGAQRGAWMGALEGVAHERRTDPRIGNWIGEIDAESLTDVEAANLRWITRQFERNSKIPSDLARDLARVTSEAQAIWAKARANDDFASFRGTLAQVLELRRAEASAVSNGGDLYDALLDDYEPGMASSQIAALFDGMRGGLVELRAEVAQNGRAVPDLRGSFSSDQQMFLTQELARVFGYDFDRGRVDLAVHPFSSGSFNDVRITTRVAENDPFNCFYSTIHEVGHATYEQGIDPSYGLSLLGRGVSMGVHESQSRILENQLGRSRAFTGYLYSRMIDIFGDFGISSADEFYRVVNKMRDGFIRTEADEVQYNLHVMLRFDLERQLISGELEVADLETAWNDRFLADFGFAVDKPSNGVLQDVHWSVGLFGYFPTYSLGNVYAGELFAKLSVDVPNLMEDLAKGDTSQALTWLGQHIHQHGALRDPVDTMINAIGHTPTADPLMTYLQQKFSGIYGL